MRQDTGILTVKTTAPRAYSRCRNSSLRFRFRQDTCSRC